MNSAIIVAAGSGQRFGGTIPKQLVDLAGKPLIFRTIDKFDQCEQVDEIVLVLSDEGREFVISSAEFENISKSVKIVSGGEFRAASVKNGLDNIDGRTKIVAVHDAARPLILVEDIAKVIAAAGAYGAACLTAEVTDTIKVVNNGRITGTIDRTTLRKALTPQAFRAEILRQAFEVSEIDSSVTDECSLVERLGIDIIDVPGDPINIKITRFEDLEFAKRCFE